jgi:hypothetical protein
MPFISSISLDLNALIGNIAAIYATFFLQNHGIVRGLRKSIHIQHGSEYLPHHLNTDKSAPHASSTKAIFSDLHYAIPTQPPTYRLYSVFKGQKQCNQNHPQELQPFVQAPRGYNTNITPYVWKGFSRKENMAQYYSTHIKGQRERIPQQSQPRDIPEGRIMPQIPSTPESWANISDRRSSFFPTPPPQTANRILPTSLNESLESTAPHISSA